jgi:hypothetical protein
VIASGFGPQSGLLQGSPPPPTTIIIISLTSSCSVVTPLRRRGLYSVPEMSAVGRRGSHACFSSPRARTFTAAPIISNNTRCEVSVHPHIARIHDQVPFLFDFSGFLASNQSPSSFPSRELSNKFRWVDRTSDYGSWTKRRENRW